MRWSVPVILAFVVGCGGSDGATLFAGALVQDDAAAPAVDSGAVAVVDGSSSAGDDAGQDAGAVVAPGDDASSADASDSAPTEDAGTDAGDCPQGCALPDICGGSGNPHACGDSCMTNSGWLPTCTSHGINATWAVPFGCTLAYRIVNGATVEKRSGGVSGCSQISADGGEPILCCP